MMPVIHGFQGATPDLDAPAIASRDLRNMIHRVNYDLVFCQLVTATGSHRKDAFERLSLVYEGSIEPNWDGDGAAPIPADAYFEAARFLQLLPDVFPTPDVDRDPDGSLTFEWYVRRKRHCIVSFYGNSIATYAAIIGNPLQTAHGSFLFFSEIPKHLYEILKLIYQLDWTLWIASNQPSA